MIKFGIDFKDEMFVFEADETLVHGCDQTHKQIIDDVCEDFSFTNDAFWRVSSLELMPGIFTANIELVGTYTDGDFDLVLKNIKEI